MSSQAQIDDRRNLGAQNLNNFSRHEARNHSPAPEPSGQRPPANAQGPLSGNMEPETNDTTQ